MPVRQRDVGVTMKGLITEKKVGCLYSFLILFLLFFGSWDSLVKIDRLHFN